MTSQLRVVRPPDRAGLLRRAYATLATTRAAKATSRRVNWKLDPWLLRVSGGRLATTLMFPCAVLETEGARSGLVRRNAIIYFHDGDRVTIFASNAGSPDDPSWFHNLRANPLATLGGVAMRADIVFDPAEQARLNEMGDRVFPGFRTYRKQAARCGREVAVVQLSPVR